MILQHDVTMICNCNDTPYFWRSCCIGVISAGCYKFLFGVDGRLDCWLNLDSSTHDVSALIITSDDGKFLIFFSTLASKVAFDAGAIGLVKVE